MVAAGAGITLLPRLALTVPRDDLAVRPLAGDGPSRLVVAAVRRGDQPRPPWPCWRSSRGGPAAQRLVKALSPVISRPTMRLWMASVPS